MVKSSFNLIFVCLMAVVELAGNFSFHFPVISHALTHRILVQSPLKIRTRNKKQKRNQFSLATLNATGLGAMLQKCSRTGSTCPVNTECAYTAVYDKDGLVCVPVSDPCMSQCGTKQVCDYNIGYTRSYFCRNRDLCNETCKVGTQVCGTTDQNEPARCLDREDPCEGMCKQAEKCRSKTLGNGVVLYTCELWNECPEPCAADEICGKNDLTDQQPARCLPRSQPCQFPCQDGYRCKLQGNIYRCVAAPCNDECTQDQICGNSGGVTGCLPKSDPCGSKCQANEYCLSFSRCGHYNPLCVSGYKCWPRDKPPPPPVP